MGRIAAAERALAAVGPQAVLRRGFSVTLRSDGLVARSASELDAGERITTRLADGQVSSIVEPVGASTPPRPARRAGQGNAGSPGLFG
jgi:exodeoxyribonuclease VII large subunit